MISMGVWQMTAKKNKYERLPTAFHDSGHSSSFITSILYGDYPPENKSEASNKNPVQ